LKDHDIFIVFGDLNFRIDLEYETTLDILKKGDTLLSLQEHDQFIKERAINTNLNILEEGPLSFLPTYKYEIGNNKFTMKKKRTPSW